MNDVPRIDRPQPMFGKCKLVRGGPWVPGRIWLDDSIPERPAVLLAEINGKETDTQSAWVRLLGNPITEAEFHQMSHTKTWAEEHAPFAPQAMPTKPIDLSRQAAILPRRK